MKHLSGRQYPPTAKVRVRVRLHCLPTARESIQLGGRGQIRSSVRASGRIRDTFIGSVTFAYRSGRSGIGEALEQEGTAQICE